MFPMLSICFLCHVELSHTGEGDAINHGPCRRRAPWAR